MAKTERVYVRLEEIEKIEWENFARLHVEGGDLSELVRRAVDHYIETYEQPQNGRVELSLNDVFSSGAS